MALRFNVNINVWGKWCNVFHAPTKRLAIQISVYVL